MNRKEEISAVKQLGEKIGYGNLMDIASGLWAIKTGHPMHMPSVKGFMTEEGKKVALCGIEVRISELKRLGVACTMSEPYRESEDNMERLTYVAENGEVLFHPADLPDDEGITITQLAKDGRYKALEEIAERLANREQAEEQGLLLRLPCKIGDTMYEIYRDGEYCTSWWDIRQRKFTLAFYEKHLNEFHKTVFLTQEEAEARLKDMEESDGR